MGNPLDALSVQVQSAINPTLSAMNTKANTLLGGVVVVPVPLPPPPLPISSTVFQVSPYAEKIIVDPYKTSELSILSEAELAVDNVVDYLSSILPEDLVTTLKKLPELNIYLVKQGMDLSSFMYMLSNGLPPSTDMAALLRCCPIMTIIANIENFTNSLLFLGLEIASIPNAFTISAFTFIDSISNAVESIAYASQLSTLSAIDTVGLVPVFASNLITNAAIGIAQITMMIANSVSITAGLIRMGISLPSTLLQMITLSSSVSFGIISNGITYLGAVISNSLIEIDNAFDFTDSINVIVVFNDNNTLFTVSNVVLWIGYQPTINLNNMLITYPTPVKVFITGITTYSIQTVQSVDSFITTYSSTIALNVINNLIQFPIADIINVLNEVKTLGLANYNNQYGSGSYTQVLDDVSSFTVETVLIFANLLTIDTSTNVNNFITILPQISTNDKNTLYSIVNDTDVITLNKSVNSLSSLNTTNVTKSLTIINTVTPTNVITLINALKIMTPTQLLSFITASKTIDNKTLLANISQLSTLSTTEIATIVSLLSQDEIYTLISNAGITGNVLDYTIRSALEIAAKAGNYRMVLNILANYKNTVSNDYLRYIVTTLMANYKLRDDDITMGISIAANFFSNALYTILPNWDTILRNNMSISQQAPFLTASADSLLLLSKYPSTAISAILQLDNQYIA